MEHQQAADLIFGTWPLKGDATREATEMALDVGYRRIDTAQWYENEAEVGDALRSAGLRRDDVRITTKVKPDNIGPDRFLPSVRESLDMLGLDRVDLLLMHWPVRDDAGFCQTIEALNEARDRGWTTTIGISNATTAQMRRAVEVTNAPVLINQVEFHPLIDQSKVQKVAAELGIALEGYCSLGRGQALGQSITQDIAAKHGASEAQIILSWLLAQGVSPVTMSTKRANAAANLASRALVLSPAEIQAISTLRSRHLRVVSIADLEPEWDTPGV